MTFPEDTALPALVLQHEKDGCAATETRGSTSAYLRPKSASAIGSFIVGGFGTTVGGSGKVPLSGER
jgi:hypothetical protein